MNRVTRTSWLVSMKNHFAGRLNDSRVKRESIVLEMNFIGFIENSKIDHRLVVDQFLFFFLNIILSVIMHRDPISIDLKYSIDFRFIISISFGFFYVIFS